MQFNASHKAFLSPEISAKLAAAPPASYSLLDQLNHTPSERDQGTCGNCWAWAGTAVMEIDYARQRGTSERFSVQFLNSNFNDACCGGWLSDVADFYGEKGIIVPWSNENALYQDRETECGSCSAVSPSDISTSPSYAIDSISDVSIPTHGIPQEEAIENIKNVLLQGKAVWFAFFLPDSSSWDSFLRHSGAAGRRAPSGGPMHPAAAATIQPRAAGTPFSAWATTTPIPKTATGSCSIAGVTQPRVRRVSSG